MSLEDLNWITLGLIALVILGVAWLREAEMRGMYRVEWVRRTFWWPHPRAREARRLRLRPVVGKRHYIGRRLLFAEGDVRGGRAWLLGLLVGPLFAWLCWSVSRRRWAQASLALAANIALWVGGGFALGEMGLLLRGASGA